MELLLKYFPHLSEHQLNQYKILAELYKDWNLKINVVSRKDIDELYLRHVLHSLGIAKVQSFKPDARILDVGTGGGFNFCAQLEVGKSAGDGIGAHPEEV